MNALHTWRPEALATSLALAMALSDDGPANDNGSQPRGRSSTAPGLAVGSRDEHVAHVDPEGRREAAQEKNREMHPALDALNSRQVDADALREISLAPFLTDPKLTRP